MRLPRGAPLDLGLAFGGNYARFSAGRLAMSEGLAQLEWSDEVIDQSLSIAGLYYPPEPGLHAARGHEFGGLHGFLADALPDGWGALILKRRLANLGVDIDALTPLERLAIVGEGGRGALVFEPATTPGGDVETLDLDALAEDSFTIVNGEDGKLGDTLARLAGGGSGGARPKINVGFDDAGNISAGTGDLAPGHSAWIVKFRAVEDPVDIGPIEFAYAQMALAAGVDMAEAKLLPAKKGGGYFATKRFDRPLPGARLHMVSLCGAMEAPARSSTSYDMLMRATSAITRDQQDVAEVFRRMVFNVLAHNRDDHTKQHAFLMNDEGDWSLAPAYDLTYAAGPGGEHYLDIDGEGRNPTRHNVDQVAKTHGLSAKQVAVAVDKVRAAVSNWRKYASDAGVSTRSTKSIAEAHARVMQAF